jgi:hypothetical protein
MCRTTRRKGLAAAALLAGLFGLGLAGARPAGAAPADDENALIEQGKALRMAGDDEGAFKFYLRAYNVAKSGRAATQLGMCEYNLARWVDAEAHLTQALKTNDAYVNKNRKVIVDFLRDVRTHLGHLEVTGRPSGAEVEVGGRLVGRLPLPGPIRIATGETNVRVAAPGHKTERRDVTVEPGQVRRVTIELPVESEASAGADTGAARPPARRLGVYRPPAGSSSDTAGGPPADLDADAGPPTWRRPAGWVAAGVGVVLAGAGVAALLVNKSRIDQFNDKKNAPNPTGRCNTTLPEKGGGICQTLLDQGNEAKKLGYVAIGGALVAGVTAAVLIATSTPAEVAAAPGRRRAVALSCAPSLSVAAGGVGAGGACGLRF